MCHDYRAIQPRIATDSFAGVIGTTVLFRVFGSTLGGLYGSHGNFRGWSLRSSSGGPTVWDSESGRRRLDNCGAEESAPARLREAQESRDEPGKCGVGHCPRPGILRGTPPRVEAPNHMGWKLLPAAADAVHHLMGQGAAMAKLLGVGNGMDQLRQARENLPME